LVVIKYPSKLNIKIHAILNFLAIPPSPLILLYISQVFTSSLENNSNMGVQLPS
jgi:phage-related holin